MLLHWYSKILFFVNLFSGNKAAPTATSANKTETVTVLIQDDHTLELVPRKEGNNDADSESAVSITRCGSTFLMNQLAELPAACRFFEEKLNAVNGVVSGRDIIGFLVDSGFLMDDPRFEVLFKGSMINEHEYRENISIDDFAAMLVGNGNGVLIEKAFRGNLVVPDFKQFKKMVIEIFTDVQRDISEIEGKPADYIPQLAKVDPNLFGMSVCTVDGQRFHFGDADVDFSIQSCCKPLLYAFALEENGQQKVHEHIGREPSGVAFNSLCLNSKNRPHNPMINAGAIMSCSLVQQGKELFERFEHVSEQLKRLSNKKWGFSNSIFLSEKKTASKNFCLGHMMEGCKAFPEGTNLEETLDFYFQCCSMETDCKKVAVAGATLANMGVCPLTGDKVLKASTCRDSLSLMYSCGMYDYSGEWAFSVGIPAKSGVSGVIFAVIPDFGCITLYAPPLDHIGNSVRGIEFFKRLVSKFSFHNFDSGRAVTANGKLDPRKNIASHERERRIQALYAAAEGDILMLMPLLRAGVSVNAADYDGRTMLHLAASNGHEKLLRHLLKYPNLDVFAEDRWNGTAYSDAVKHGHEKIAEVLKRRMESEMQKMAAITE